MIKKFLTQKVYIATITLLFLLLGNLTLAQSTGNYSYSTNNTGSLVDMSSGTTDIFPTGTYRDDFASSVFDIGFVFVFMGTPYTQFSINSNGQMRLGSTAIGGGEQSPAAGIPLIAPISGDNSLQSIGKAHFKVIGTAPNRTLVVEWDQVRIPFTNDVAGTYSRFQVLLNETSGIIEFRYGRMYNMGTSASTRGVYFSSGTSAGQIGQVTNITTTLDYNSTATSLTTTSFSASSDMTNLSSTSDGSRRVFTFTPPTPPAPTGLSFSGVTASAMTLNWTDATGEFGYLIYRSLDGTNFTFVTSLAANTTSYTATGLAPGTTYYWRVYSFSEGSLSSPLSGSQATNPPSLSGTRTIGATGNYATLTAAIADVQTQGLAGALTLEFLSDYAGGETFPITLTSLSTTASRTLTIRPASGVTGISISGAHATNLIRIENEDYIIIDGRPGGTGTAKELTFSNTTDGGTTFTFINEASNNIIRYCVIRGVNTSTTSGVVFFGTTTGSNGNDNNTIEYCDIRDGASTPLNCVYSAGTTTTTAHFNSGNTISNCNIFNFFSNTTNVASGISLQSGNTDWTITENSFYQTTTRTFTAAGGFIAITIANTSGNNFTVNNNFIGGSAPSAGGSAWTQTGSVGHTFIGIRFSVGTTTASNAQGNTIRNISISTSTTSTVNAGISVTTGLVNVGNVTGNIIGDMSSTGSITFTGAGSAAAFAGILLGSGTPVSYNIQNNNIGGITIGGTGTTTFRGIWLQGTPSATITPNISNNTIGGSVANSISNSTNLPSYGIHFSSTSTLWSPTVNSNIVRNINASSTGAAVLCYGIYFQTGGAHTVIGNTVSNLSTQSTNTTIQLIGIMLSNTSSGGNTISQNTIHTLKQTNSGSGTAHHAYGIYYNAGTTGTNVISRNFIHSLSLATTGSSTTTQIRGLEIFAGAVTVVNNMVRVGIDEAGNSITGNYFIQGINKSSGGNVNIYHNSVFVGGTGVVTGTQQTHAFRRATTGVDDVRNNIFVNARSNGTGTGKHYGILLNNATTITSNYNLFHITGTGGVFGSADNGTTDRANLSAWQTTTGFDFNSAHGSPNYVNATGSASAVDLHVQNPTPIEAHGVLISSVTDDFDGATRSGLTPVDIGADAGNFTLTDIFPPSISYSVLLNTTSTSNRTLASVTITDVTGVPTSGTLQPRIWFRRSSAPATSWGSTQGSLTTGSGTNGVWSFTIDYSVIGVTPVVGETYQYYVVAQDEATTPNLITNPIGGVHTDVNTQTSAPSTPNSYNIVTGFSGTINVGAGETYPTLTGGTGLFQALNGGALTGNVTVNITSNLTEDGTHGLNQLVSEGGSFTLTIQPSAAVERLISGNVSVTNGMIRFNGADNVTIDGRHGGSGQYLRFRNINTSQPTITLLNDASNNTIRNCFIEGATTSTTHGVVFFFTGTTTGNDNNTIQNCIIRDRSDVSGVPGNLVYSSGSSATITNTGNSLLNNELFNFTSNGVNLTSTGNENWTINGNEIYQTASRTTALVGVTFNSLGTTNVVSQNVIRAMNTTGSVRGISLHDARNTTVSRNKINQTTVAGSSLEWNGIYFAGSSGNPASVTLVNNQIIIIPTTSSSQTIRGIYDFGFLGNTINVFFNSVYIGGTATGSATWAYVRGTSTPTTTTIRNNLFTNNRSGGSVNHFACGDLSTGTGTFTVSNNFYSGLGTTPANFMDNNSTAESFSSWRTSRPDRTSFASVASDITFTNLYVDHSTGDLNIINTNPECWLVNGKGIALSGIADDFGATGVRSTSSGAATDIGSDEFTPSGGGSTPPEATASGAPAPSTTTTYTTSGNTNGSIAWGAGGTVPTSITFRYYSGIQPPGPGTKANFYWDITASGGSGYSYNITLTYDEGQLNGIPEANLHPAKSDDGGTTWTAYLTEGTGPGQFQRNTTNNTITVFGLTSFSLFGFGDTDSPVPVELSSFTSHSKERDVILNWQTQSEVNMRKFVVERKSDKDDNWVSVSEIQAAGNSNSPKDYSYIDKKLNSGSYSYRLKMIDIDGTYSYSSIVEETVELPKEYAISQNYPNPFNPSTRIDYQLPFDSKVMIELYSITGERVAMLNDKVEEAGYYTLEINGSSLGLASGVYIYRIVAQNLSNGQQFMSVKKMMMIK